LPLEAGVKISLRKEKEAFIERSKKPTNRHNLEGSRELLNTQEAGHCNLWALFSQNASPGNEVTQSRTSTAVDNITAGG
jgi:hypothetical protein